MTVEGGVTRTGLVSRVKNILLSPKTEWEVIDNEPATVQGLFLGYAMILAAIPAIASFVGGQLFGAGVPGFSYKMPLVGALVIAVVTYIGSLISLAILGVIIKALAPSFGGVADGVKAFKVAVYSMTAAWVAGVLGIFPAIAVIGALLGLYGFYLLYLGLPRLMKAPQEKAVGYTVVTVIIAIVVQMVIFFAIAAVTTPMIMAGALASGSGPGGKLTIGGTSVDLGELERASKDLEKAAESMEAAAAGGAVNIGATTEGDVLQALLPAALPGGYTRTETSSGGMSGVASGAEAIYTKGDSRIELNVVDSGAMGALAGMAGSMKSERTTADGYEKMGQVNGRLTTEEYNRSSNSGKYGVMVGNRFMIEAQGSKVTMSELKAAVESIPFARLEAMAKG